MAYMYIKPVVKLVTRQVLDVTGLDSFLAEVGADHTLTGGVSAGDAIPEIAGRLCYMSFGAKAGRKDNGSYLQHILESAHGAVTEHTVFGFLIAGVSRSLSHELVRHRLASYSQLSQRYVDSSDARFVLPPALAGLPEDTRKELVDKLHARFEQDLALYDEITEELANSYTEPQRLVEFAVQVDALVDTGKGTGPTTYRDTTAHGSGDCATSQTDSEHGDLATWANRVATDVELRKRLKAATLTVRRKSAREAARCVLPNMTETRIFVTMNVRALRHFLEMRGSPFADKEIRQLAVEMLRVLKAEAPNLFQDMRCELLADGSEIIVSDYKKV